MPAAPETAVREYVWGPAYVDELVAQLAADGGPSSPAVWFYLLDANFNVVGLTDAAGAMAEQYTFEPYGGVALRDAAPSGPQPTSTAGHQGLFCYRLDGPASAPALSPAAQGLYYNRNRWYSPALGRFTSRDPHATAMAVLNVMAANPSVLDVTLGTFDPTNHFADGVNLYSRNQSNGVRFTDPSGAVSLDLIAAQSFTVGMVAGIIYNGLANGVWRGAWTSMFFSVGTAIEMRSGGTCSIGRLSRFVHYRGVVPYSKALYLGLSKGYGLSPDWAIKEYTRLWAWTQRRGWSAKLPGPDTVMTTFSYHVAEVVVGMLSAEIGFLSVLL